MRDGYSFAVLYKLVGEKDDGRTKGEFDADVGGGKNKCKVRAHECAEGRFVLGKVKRGINDAVNFKVFARVSRDVAVMGANRNFTNDEL